MIKQGKAKFSNPVGGAAIKVRVNTEAGKNRIKKVDTDSGLVTIDLVCDKDQINNELTSFLMQLLNAKKREIEILDSVTDADKVVCILGKSVEKLNTVLK